MAFLSLWSIRGNVGLKETLNPTKRVCIGSPGAGMFDGRLPCINIGDNDSGFIGSADGVIDIYANSVKVGYIDPAGLHMLRDIATTGTVHSGSGILTTNGDVYGPVWGSQWLSVWLNSQLTARDNNINTRATWDWVNQNFVNDITLGEEVYYSPGSNIVSWIFHAPAGHVFTGINVQDTGAHSADNIGGVYYKPIQKKVNGVTMTISG